MRELVATKACLPLMYIQGSHAILVVDVVYGHHSWLEHLIASLLWSLHGDFRYHGT